MEEKHYDRIFPILEKLGLEIHDIAESEDIDLRETVMLQTKLLYESCVLLIKAHDYATTDSLTSLKDALELVIKNRL